MFKHALHGYFDSAFPVDGLVVNGNYVTAIAIDARGMFGSSIAWNGSGGQLYGLYVEFPSMYWNNLPKKKKFKFQEQNLQALTVGPYVNGLYAYGIKIAFMQVHISVAIYVNK